MPSRIVESIAVSAAHGRPILTICITNIYSVVWHIDRIGNTTPCSTRKIWIVCWATHQSMESLQWPKIDWYPTYNCAWLLQSPFFFHKRCLVSMAWHVVRDHVVCICVPCLRLNQPWGLLTPLDSIRVCAKLWKTFIVHPIVQICDHQYAHLHTTMILDTLWIHSSQLMPCGQSMLSEVHIRTCIVHTDLTCQ